MQLHGLGESQVLAVKKNLQSAECGSQHLYFTVRARTPGEKIQLWSINSFIFYLQLHRTSQQVYVDVKYINNWMGFVDKSGLMACA